jgi:superfamily II DNA or RNA helicase
MDLKLSEDKKYLEVVKFDSLDELDQLEHSLTKKMDKYQFMPSYKKGWDGTIHFFDNIKNRFLSGLWKYSYDTLKKYGYDCKLYGIRELFDNEINYDEFKEFTLNLMKDNEKTPREYQIRGAYNILKFRRSTSLMSTSSGKTLIVYCALAYGIQKGLMKNILMIVPNISLVGQAANDFIYDYNDKDQIDMRVQQIYHGKERMGGENITIGTFQSLVKLDRDYYKKFDAVIIDETHKATTKSIKTIMDKLWHCKYRFGLTGTLPKPKTANYLTVLAQLGPVVNNIDANSLIEEGFITPVKVKILKLNYLDKDTKESFYNLTKRLESTEAFQQEKRFVATSVKRLKYVTSVINNVTKNTLVLFHLIEHGKALYEQMVKLRGKENVFYVDGQTKPAKRDLYKKKMEDGECVILIASYGTFSTGISIKKIHNIFLTESFKSDVIIRQSIGRGLRLHSDKKVLNVIDFVDDFSFTTIHGYSYKNFILKHSKERIRIYKSEKFPYEIQEVEF